MKQYVKIGLVYITQLLAMFWQPLLLSNGTWLRIIATEIIVGFMVLIYVMVSFTEDF